jgi:SulP family sulfate permease
MAGLTAAGLSLLVIVVIAPALSVLPRAVLGAIVVNAVWKLMDVTALRRYARVRRNDIVAAAIAAVGVLAFGPLYGLLLAVAGSVLGLVYRSSRVEIDVMGRLAEEKAAWGSVRDHPERSTVPGILVLRMDTPIFWVTASPVADAILAEVEVAEVEVAEVEAAEDEAAEDEAGKLEAGKLEAGKLEAGKLEAGKDVKADVKAVVLDLQATHQMDTTSADALADLLAALRARGVDLYLVRVMWAVRRGLRRSGLMAEIGEDHLWHSISQAVREARRAHGIGPAAAADAGEDAAEEHIAARSTRAAGPDGAEPGWPSARAGVRFRAGNARPRDSREADG